jgi:type I restriction enzyme S subunit
MSFSGWKEIKLGNVCEINKSSYSKNDSWEFINYLDTGNITENQIDEIKYIVPGIDKVPSRARRKVDINDIIYSTVRPNQRHYGIIKSPLKNMLVSTGFVVITSNRNEVDSQYLYYYLSQDNIVEMLHMLGEHSTSAYPSIKPSDIENLVIFLPPLPEQKAIAATLSCLDDKIELNNRINKNLEEMAQAIFRSWFVDFEPFQDGEFEDSELGRIPKGWRVGTLKDISKDIVCGKTPYTKEEDNFGNFMLFVTIPDMHGNVFVLNTERYLSKKGVATQANKTLPKNSVCVSCIATPGLVILTSEKSQTNQQINSIICNESISYYYVFLFLRSYGNEIRNMGSGGSATLNLNKTEFAKIKLIIPDNITINAFHSTIQPVFDRILEGQKENCRLMGLRDTLLPKLMSGEIIVPMTK